MKQTGILMSKPMVLAMLQKRKTQTRRTRGLEEINGNPDAWHLVNSDGQKYGRDDAPIWWNFENGYSGRKLMVKCPYGGLGDMLYIREMLRCVNGEWFYNADGLPVMVDPKYQLEMVAWAHHKEQDYASSMFMPRWACRLERPITKMRCERVQTITEADCIAEGVRYPVTTGGHPLLEISSKHCPGDYLKDKFKNGKYIGNSEDWIKAHYASLWDTLNAKRYPWSMNPWVWVPEWVNP
jgi:hypothetical protein